MLNPHNNKICDKGRKKKHYEKLVQEVKHLWSMKNVAATPLLSWEYKMQPVSALKTTYKE